MILAGPLAAAWADQEVPLDTALQTMQALAGRIGNARWDVRTEHGTLSADNKFEPTDVGTTGKVVFEPTSGRYRANLESVCRWYDGADPFMAERSQCAFDGSRSRILRRAKAGKALPPAKPVPDSPDGFPGEGKVWGDTAEFFRLFHWCSGVGYFPPYFMGMSLVDRIQQDRSQGKPVRVTADDRGLWHIEFVYWEVKTNDHLVVVDYDRGRGGVITKAISKHKTLPNSTYRQIDYDYQKVGGDYWVPKLVRNTWLKNNPVNSDRLHYANVKVNEPVDERAFRIEFPAGSQVIDYVEKKAYTVGGKPKDEQAMIKAFTRMHGLSAKPPVPFWKRTVWYWAPGLFAVAALVFVIRYRRRRIAAAAVLGLILATAPAGPAAEPDIAPGGSGDVGRKVHLTQCGFRVSVFTMAALGVDCDADAVATDLMPAGFDGISLASVQKVLQGHRLRAEARQNFTVAELKQALRSGWVAIIPVEGKPSCHDYDMGGQASVWDHYIVALHHPEQGPVLIDVLSSIAPLDRSALQDQHLRNPKRAVLFVRR